MAHIVHKDGATTIHHDGKLYKPDKKGVFEVPDEIVAVLRPHNFITVAEAEEQAAQAAASDTTGTK